MNSLFVKLASAAAVGILLSCSPTVTQQPAETTQLASSESAQLPSSEQKAARLEITKEPALEIALDDFAIVRWTTKNPGGTDVHYGIVHYGTDPQDLSQTAKNPIRINRAHPETVFRVRMPDLKPQTTYYYKVVSTDSNGKSHEVESPVNQFTTPAPGERIVAYPPQPPK
jgi:Purple acid Phosphatase, N-terminal domain